MTGVKLIITLLVGFPRVRNETYIKTGRRSPREAANRIPSNGETRGKNGRTIFGP